MKNSVNDTHDSRLRSWIESANTAHTNFPIQNLPFGVFKHNGDKPRIGVAIGDLILDLKACYEENCFDDLSRHAAQACTGSTLNELMQLGAVHWSALRRGLSELLRVDSRAAEENKIILEKHLAPIAEAEMLLPIEIGDYTDFYASIYHATNVGSMFRPDNPLLPNYKYVPIGYHGRASSVVVNGTPVRRPHGQTRAEGAEQPTFGASKRLDYELEVGFFVGQGNQLGEQIKLAEAEQHIFGLCLVNDWSARDIQTWEYQPLGPFLAKSFATTISPWVVTMEALAPFRTSAFKRPEGDPEPLSYLDAPINRERGGIDLELEVLILSQRMREQNLAPVRLSRSNFRDMYWTIAQMLTHHASNGCNLRAGDLIASGTVSGAAKDARGCLLELAWRGTEPVELPSGETRRFLEDADEIILRGYCERDGFARIGFGECRGTVSPATE